VFVLGKLLRLMKSLEPGNKFDPKLWSKIIFFLSMVSKPVHVSGLVKKKKKKEWQR